MTQSSRRSSREELHELAGNDEPVLLRGERSAEPEVGRAFCHRRIVANAFAERLGER